MSNIFEVASRNKYRFESKQGLLAVEQLWDLTLLSLDSIAKGINKFLKNEGDEESFLENNSAASAKNREMQTKLEIVKHIISVKQEENKKADTKAKIAKLKELAADKAEDKLKSMTVEEIQTMIAELEKTA